MKEKIKFDKIYGCLMGVACGDAMGMPTSMMDPETIRNTFGTWIESFLPAPPNHIIHNAMRAGQITDDTQQTLLLVDTILENGEIRPEYVATRLIRWAEGLNAFESTILGPSSLRALNAIRNGVPIEKAGAFGDTNGAAMKISPIGIIHPGDIEATVTDVAKVCLPTHNTNIAIAGASAIACAVCMAMVTDDMETVISAFFDGIRLGMKKGRSWYGASLERRSRWALDLVKRAHSQDEVISDLYDLIGAGVAITESVPTALALFVYAKGDPVYTIQLAANMGGDCDTVGAIAGAMAGTFRGITAFPDHYHRIIDEVNQLSLKNYALRLSDFIKSRG